MKPRPLFAAAIVLALSSSAYDARADEKQICVAASEKAQQLRNAGKLEGALAELAICRRETCPKLVQHDCVEWSREVFALLPSVVPAAKDKRGRDVIDVKVSVDGKVVAEILDGKSLALDPGVHTFRFETKNAPPVDEQVVVRPGEKNRIVTITFAMPAEPATVPVTPAKEAPVKTESRPPLASIILGGAGVAALGAALFVGLDANGDARDLRETCAPNCDQSQVDDIEKRRVIAGVTAGVGGALLVASAVLFFMRGAGASKSAKTPFVPLAHGGAATLIRF